MFDKDKLTAATGVPSRGMFRRSAPVEWRVARPWKTNINCYNKMYAILLQ